MRVIFAKSAQTDSWDCPVVPRRILDNPSTLSGFTLIANQILVLPFCSFMPGQSTRTTDLRLQVLTLAELLKMRVKARLVFAGRFDWSKDPEDTRRDIRVYLSVWALQIKWTCSLRTSYLQAPRFPPMPHLTSHPGERPVPHRGLGSHGQRLTGGIRCSWRYLNWLGKEAGIGVRDVATWENIVRAPAPRALAQAVVAVLAEYRSVCQPGESTWSRSIRSVALGAATPAAVRDSPGIDIRYGSTQMVLLRPIHDLLPEYFRHRLVRIC